VVIRISLVFVRILLGFLFRCFLVRADTDADRAGFCFFLRLLLVFVIYFLVRADTYLIRFALSLFNCSMMIIEKHQWLVKLLAEELGAEF
jgi:hypothetical protein